MNPGVQAAVVLGLAGAAFGQASFTTDTDISMSWAFSDNGAGNSNNNGLLDDGETGLFSLTVSYTNQDGLAHFSPPIGGISSGTVLGLGSLFIDVREDFGQTGTLNDDTPLANNSGTSGYGVRGGWRIGGNASNGTVTPTGMDLIEIGQFPAMPGIANTLDPVTNIFRFLWTPDNFRGFFSFTVSPSPVAQGLVASVYVDLGNGTGTSIFVPLDHVHFASVSQDIPAPSAAAILVPALGWAASRRRRRGSSDR